MTIPSAKWPEARRMSVTFCFDVDGESSWILDEQNHRRLSLLSASAFGRRIGVGRILNLMEKHSLHANFFVPGYTAEIDPTLVHEIHERGHSVGCHGYYHERTDGLTFEQEDDILHRSIQRIESITGVRPIGYRAPLWEVSPQTLTLLHKHGFVYDSSLMGADFPYEVNVPGSEDPLFEIPVTWLLDDWEQFAYSAEPANGYVIEDPDKVLHLWKREFEALYETGGAFTLTMHPEIIGRASRMHMLDQLVSYMKEFEGVWFCSLDNLYNAWREGVLVVPRYDY